MWFAFCKDCNGNSSSLPSTYLPRSEIGIDSTFYIYSKPTVDAQKDLSVRIDEVYRLMPTYWKKKKWAIWKPGYGLEVTDVIIWERRGDLTGVVIRASSVEVSIFSFI